MAHIERADKESKIKKYAIYVIVFSDNETFFVGKCKDGTQREAYKTHYILRNAKTKEIIEQEKKTNSLPKLFVVDSLETSISSIKKHCVAWAKYFLDHGFKLLQTQQILMSYTESMQGETLKVYEKIKQIPLEEIYSPEKNLFPHYGLGHKINKNKAKTKRPLITLRLTEKDYLKIAESAKENSLTVTAYCRNMALNGMILHADFDFMRDYKDELRQTNNMLILIRHDIYRKGNYDPADMKNLQRLINQVMQLHAEAIAQINDTMKNIKELTMQKNG